MLYTHRPSLAVLTSGLMIAVGSSSGCQLFRSSRISEEPRSRWHHVETPSLRDEGFDDEYYVPESEITAPSPRVNSSSPSLILPPEPVLPQSTPPVRSPQPAPPAAEAEPAPQARWRPALPRRSTSVSHDTQFSQDLGDLPPARVTYNSDTESPSDTESTIAEPEQPGQPRLFQPAGSVRNMFDSVKRKWSR